MSGGSYDFAYTKVNNFADDLRCGETPDCPIEDHKHDWRAQDACIDCRHEDSPGCYGDAELRKRFREHLRKVAEAMRAIEWNDSGDGDSQEAEKILACLKGDR